MQQRTALTLFEFLANSKRILTSTTQLRGVNIVLGNGTADMDSSVGSILLAYILQCTNSDKHYVPLINTSANKFQSNFDVVHVLRDLLSELVFLDQVNIHQLTQYHLILYDHNIPEVGWIAMRNQVVQIVDHHDDKTATYYQQEIQKNIQKVGSAITLVAGMYVDEQLTPSIRQMICSTIALDTFNFDSKQKGVRWVDEDMHQFQRMQAKVPTDYHFLNNLKYSKEMNLNLDFDVMLNKDYKLFHYSNGLTGYAVIFVSLDSLLTKYDSCELEQRIMDFKVRSNLQTLVLMFVYQSDDRLERKILILDANAANLERINEEFVVRQQLNLRSEQSAFKQTHLYYTDVEAQYTRKTIEPILSAIL